MGEIHAVSPNPSPAKLDKNVWRNSLGFLISEHLTWNINENKSGLSLY